MTTATRAGELAATGMPAAFELPETLTPTKISAFTACPLAFRFSVLEHLPEPSSIPAVRGTLVHRALQLLFTYADGAGRDRETAQRFLEEAFYELSASSSELAGLGLDEQGRARLLAEAGRLVDNYFQLEDPTTIRPAGLELDMSFELDGIKLRGIIDRLDVLPGGGFAVVDYKTGRSPRPEQAKTRMGGVQLYALLCEAIIGERPRSVRLLYLKDRVAISAEPTDMTLRAVRQRAGAVWKAIERACSSRDFRPNPSPLCSWCSFKDFCPAFGGDPDGPR